MGIGAIIGGVGYITYIYLTLPDVRSLKITNPASTALIDLRFAEGQKAGKNPRRLQRWVSHDRISRHLQHAVLAAKNAPFLYECIDSNEPQKLVKASWKKKPMIGSHDPITQQLVQNLYLLPEKDSFFNLREFLLTQQLESELSKCRIFEIYLNVVEWGDGIWGVQVASLTYFNIPASALNSEQSALLAATLANSRFDNPINQSKRLLRRKQFILERMSETEPPTSTPTVISPAIAPVPAYSSK
ncbi:monofunctional biosynthetic peptidoglycan transglycosylase [Nitrosomonas sp. PY1]|nr:monofunctional biosynthetic peptidoglycan transglycosylase [Nitrosomonas sp. PY1]